MQGELPPAAGADSDQSGGLSAQHAPDLRCDVLQCDQGQGPGTGRAWMRK